MQRKNCWDEEMNMKKMIKTLLLSNGGSERTIKDILEENRPALMDGFGYLSDKNPDLSFSSLLINSKKCINDTVAPFAMVLVHVTLTGDDKEKLEVNALKRIDNGNDTVVYSANPIII